MSKPVITKMPSTPCIRSDGFTLVEFVITFIVIGILSAVVLTNFNARIQHSANTQADEFRRNLSHLQLLAISQGVRLKLTVTSSNYSVCTASTSPCNSGSALTDPAAGLSTAPTAGQTFSVTMADGVSFTQGAGDYFFDTLGRPVTAATGSTLKPDMSPFTLRGSGHDVSVTVLPLTGFAQTS